MHRHTIKHSLRRWFPHCHSTMAAAVPVIAPVPANDVSTTSAVAALGQVMAVEQFQEMTRLRRELTWSRRALEETRSAMMSPYRLNGRVLDWHEIAEDRQEVIDRLTDEGINPAMDKLRNARRALRVSMRRARGASRVAMRDARHAMTVAMLDLLDGAPMDSSDSD